ncbi:MAG: proton-conducting transporter membrane subunit, partial [Pseudomonadota bacterium]
IDELSGLIRRSPGLALALTVLVISVAGFPLAFGFLGKLAVFEAGIEGGLLPLVIILVISSVIAFGYYLRLILIMWVKEPVEGFEPVGNTVTGVVYLTAAASLALFIFIAPLSDLAFSAAQSLLP